MLNKRQTQQATYCTIPFLWNSRIGKSMETESREAIVEGWEEQRGGETADGHKSFFSFLFIYFFFVVMKMLWN